MPDFAPIMYWITSVTSRKKYDDIKEEIKETHWILIILHRHILEIEPIIRNNFDLKPVILKWFHFSFIFNLIIFALVTLINFIYTMLGISTFLKYTGFDYEFQLSWTVSLILFSLYIIFLARYISDYYKLSLRGKYRKGYSKLLILDIVTLNIFSIIGTLIFVQNKWDPFDINDNHQIDRSTLTSQSIKNYLRLIFKVEIFIFFISLLIFAITIPTGYFLVDNNNKSTCLKITALNMIFLYLWIIPRFTTMIIFQSMFKKVTKRNETVYLLMTFRFLVSTTGYYYFAVLLPFFNLNQNSMNYILENW